MTEMRNLINKLCEHALTATVDVGDKVLVKTTSLNTRGVVTYVSRHGDIITVRFPHKNTEQTFYSDQVHPLKEVVLDVIARDKTFPYHRYFYKVNNKIIGISCSPLRSGKWKRIESVVGTEDNFVNLVKDGKIRNVDFTRPLGRDKEDVKSLQKTKESKNSEIEELDLMCRNLLAIDEEFTDYLLEHGIGPQEYGDLNNSVYTAFLLKMKEDIRNRSKT